MVIHVAKVKIKFYDTRNINNKCTDYNSLKQTFNEYTEIKQEIKQVNRDFEVK